MQHTLLIRFEWGMISLLAACCFVDVSSAVLLFSRYNQNSSAISTNLRCARCEYKILILKCCCFNSSVCFSCVSQNISNGGHFFSSRSTRFYCLAWMHVLCSYIRPTHSVTQCVCFIPLSTSLLLLLLLVVLMLIRKFYCSNSMFCAEFRDYALFLLLFEPFICQNKYVR